MNNPAPRALFLCLLFLTGLTPIARASPAVGQAAPALKVTELDGTPFDLSAMRGKVVLVNFWATWCPPCKAEMPVFDAFYRQYHDRGVEILALSVERSRARGDVRKAAQKFTFPAAMLCDAAANGFGDPDSLPDTYLLSPDGIIRATFLGGKPPITEKSLSEAVLPWLPAPKTP